MRLRPDLPDVPVDHAFQGAGVPDRGQVDVHDHDHDKEEEQDAVRHQGKLDDAAGERGREPVDDPGHSEQQGRDSHEDPEPLLSRIEFAAVDMRGIPGQVAPEGTDVITSYSIHYTKLYEGGRIESRDISLARRLGKA